MAKSKGHVSPPASERGNYPFPVREQQMIANYGGAFSGAEICQLEGEGGLIFWQLYIHFYHVFFFFSTGHLLHVFLFVACFSIHMRLHGGQWWCCFYAPELLRVYLCVLH